MRGEFGWICGHNEKTAPRHQCLVGEREIDSFAELPFLEIDCVAARVVELDPLQAVVLRNCRNGMIHDFIDDDARLSGNERLDSKKTKGRQNVCKLHTSLGCGDKVF